MSRKTLCMYIWHLSVEIMGEGRWPHVIKIVSVCNDVRRSNFVAQAHARTHTNAHKLLYFLFIHSYLFGFYFLFSQKYMCFHNNSSSSSNENPLKTHCSSPFSLRRNDFLAGHAFNFILFHFISFHFIFQFKILRIKKEREPKDIAII